MITAENLSKSFGTKKVLDKVTFTVDKPTLLTGVSGVGKTTLLRILMRLEKPDSGSCRIDGSVAVVFQEDRLIPHLNAQRNIRLTAHREIGREELAEALDAVGLSGQALTTPAAKLSGGQKRRVALLRALLCGTETLLLDEPFTGLDEETLEKTVKLTGRLVKNRPCLLVCHDNEVNRLLNWEKITLE